MATPLTILRDTYPTDDDLYKFLRSQGYRGTLGDMQMLYLLDQGLSGALNDRINKLVTVSYSVSIGSGEIISGDLLTANVSGLEGGETVTYQWRADGSDVSGATSQTFTPIIGGNVTDAEDISVSVTVDASSPFFSGVREVRYDSGTAPSVADGQSWTVDDTSVSIDASASGANLTFSYALSGAATGVSINSSTGLITGTPTGVESGTATVTATDQYGRELQDTFTWTSALRSVATAADGLGPFNWTVDDTSVNVDATTDFTTNGNTLTYTATGLPAGVSIASNGIISGTPTAASSGSIVVTGQDEYGRDVTSTTSHTTALRTQATGGADLDLAFGEDSAVTATDLTQNWTENGNTLTYAITGTALPSGLSVSSSGLLTGTPTDVTADDTYTLRGTDEYGRTTDDTFTLEITAGVGTITFTSGTYTRTSDGNAPTLNNTDIVTSGTTGPYFLDLLTVTNGTTPSQTDMDNGSGTGVLEKVTLGSEADILDLDGSIDLGTSITNGRIYQQYRDSAGAKSALTSTPTADSITYDAVAPAFSSAVVENAAPSDVVITIDKDFFDPTASISAGDFTVTGFTVSTATRTDATTITLGLSTSVAGWDDLTGDLSYTGSALVGVDGETLPTFSGQNITNNVAAAPSFDFASAGSGEDTSSGATSSITATGTTLGTADASRQFLCVFSGRLSAVPSAGDWQARASTGAVTQTTELFLSAPSRFAVNIGFVIDLPTGTGTDDFIFEQNATSATIDGGVWTIVRMTDNPTLSTSTVEFNNAATGGTSETLTPSMNISANDAVLLAAGCHISPGVRGLGAGTISWSSGTSPSPTSIIDGGSFNGGGSTAIVEPGSLPASTPYSATATFDALVAGNDFSAMIIRATP